MTVDTTPRQIADAYLGAWNEPDATRRLAAIEAGWNERSRYLDPMMSGEGHAGIASMIDAARAQFPGHAFTLRGTPEGHHDVVRFSWTLAPAGGAPVAGGTDVVRLDGRGRIAEVIGFLDTAVA